MTQPPASLEKPRCRICGTDTGRVVETTERMFGFGGEFQYFECAGCGCVQLMNVPVDLGFYYPKDLYYSLNLEPRETAPEQRIGLKRWLFRLRNQYCLFGTPPYAALLAKLRPPVNVIEKLKPFLRHLKKRSLNCRILDVGSGQGALLVDLARAGFEDLHGVDPFLNDTVPPRPEVTLHKSTVQDLDAGKFDLIISHDSLEHVNDPGAVLTAMAARLTPGGQCRVELPVAASRVWREYGGLWVDLDPPRHLFLLTRPSMDVLAKSAGLTVTSCEPAGTPWAFWGSEIYKRGKTLYDMKRSRFINVDEEFTPAEMEVFAARSKAANNAGETGRLTFWLEKASP